MQTRRVLTILAALTLATAACSASTPSAPSGASATTGTGGFAPTGDGDAASAAAAACPSPDLAAAEKVVTTNEYAKDPPWVLGASFPYMSDAYMAYAQGELLYAAGKDDRFSSVITSDAGFDASKQISNIEDLITKKVSAIIYSPVDDAALATVLQKATDAGIPTVNVGNGFSQLAGITANVQTDNYVLGREVAVRLFETMGGKGEITSMIPIAGTTAAVGQSESLRCVMKLYPDIKLLDEQNGDWNTAKAKTITEAWLQRFPKIDGIYSPGSQMSLGIVQAFEEADRLSEVMMSPTDEENGYRKWLLNHPEKNTGIVRYPVAAFAKTVEIAADILTGTDVLFGTWIGANYVPAEEAANMADAARSDTWFPNDLPGGEIPQ